MFGNDSEALNRLLFRVLIDSAGDDLLDADGNKQFVLATNGSSRSTTAMGIRVTHANINTDLNGLYLPNYSEQLGFVANSKLVWCKTSGVIRPEIHYDGAKWRIESNDAGTALDIQASNGAQQYPWLATWIQATVTREEVPLDDMSFEAVTDGSGVATVYATETLAFGGQPLFGGIAGIDGQVMDTAGAFVVPGQLTSAGVITMVAYKDDGSNLAGARVSITIKGVRA